MARSFSNSRRRSAAIPFALLVALAAGRPRHARAQEPQVAPAQEASDDDLMAEGVALRKRGDDLRALALFEKANALHPSARATAQIALARQALAQWLQAERGLTQALGAPDDPWISRNRTALEESLAAVREHLGWLDIDSDIAGAEVWIEGDLRGRTAPAAGPADPHRYVADGIRVAAGDVTVVVRAGSHPPMERTLRVEPKSGIAVSFAFVAPEVAIVPSAPAKRPRESSGTRTAGWVALGSAAGLALVGTAGAITRQWEAEIYDDDRQCGPLAGPTGTVSRYQRCGTNRDIGSAAQAIAIGAFAGAGVAAIVSSVLLLRRNDSAPPATAGGCDVVGAGMICHGRF